MDGRPVVWVVVAALSCRALHVGARSSGAAAGKCWASALLLARGRSAFDRANASIYIAAWLILGWAWGRSL